MTSEEKAHKKNDRQFNTRRFFKGSKKSLTHKHADTGVSVGAFAGYGKLLGEIKGRIRTAQVRATLAGNAGMLQLYWEIGALLVQRQKQAGWGAGVLRRLAADLHNDLAGAKGFSERNLKLMTQFFREYPDLPTIGQRTVAQLDSATNAGTPLKKWTARAQSVLLV